MDNSVRHEFLRAARVMHALYLDWQSRCSEGKEEEWWFHTGLFDLLVPDSLTVVGETAKSKVKDARRRREHVVPRLALAERCIKMFHEGKGLDEVARFLHQYLKIVWVSSEEAAAIDASNLRQKEKMPGEVGEWWLSTDNLYIRLKRANVEFVSMER